MADREMQVHEVRAQLGRLVNAAHYGGEVTVITTNGEKRAVLVPYDWYEDRATHSRSAS